MGQILVRDLEDNAIERLGRLARENHRSLEAEARDILERASLQGSAADWREAADRIRRSLEGRVHSDSADLLREDRDR